MVQCIPEEWNGLHSKRIRTEKAHTLPMRDSEELNKSPHPLFSMGAKRHFTQKLSPSYEFKPCMKPVKPFDHS